MKGLFIPEITAEMFRSGCLESIEALMAEGEIYDIDYEPEQHWIPCSKTTDIPEDYVLACDERGAEMIGYLSYKYDQWICESELEIMYDPIAWRYLPEPWEGG